MIEPEVVEEAETEINSNGNRCYQYKVTSENGLNLRNNVRQPNAYTIFKEYQDSFVIEDNVLRPRGNKNEYVVISEDNTIKNGHVNELGAGGPNEKTCDVTMDIYAEGELELTDTHDKVIGGELKITVSFRFE